MPGTTMIEIRHKENGGLLKQIEGNSLAGQFFEGAQLPGANFSGQDLSGADFQRADLRDADFSGAHYEGIFRFLDDRFSCRLQHMGLNRTLDWGCPRPKRDGADRFYHGC